MAITSNLFPPILNSSQPAFDKTISNYAVYFQLPSMLSNEDLKGSKIQIKITQQNNNKNVANLKFWPNGLIEKNYSNNGFITILKDEDIYPAWEGGIIYKIQMRFIKNGEYSEWSNVMVTKAITAALPSIANGASVGGESSVVSTQKFLSTTTPLIIGSCLFESNDREVIDKYQFILYDNNDNIIETSGWLQHNASQNSVDTYRFKTTLENQEFYKIQYSIISNNGYEASSKAESYQVQINSLSMLENLVLYTVNDTDFCKENACIQVILNSINGSHFSGNYILSRTSEHSNFTVWEDIKYFLLDNKTFNNEVIYNDFTIESGVEYKYAFQQENSAGFRTSPVYENVGTAKKSINFEYSYLYQDGLQLKLKFNNKISSFKHTVLASKSDTIGSKYPTITRNGYAYYAEFPIAGLISLNMDLEQTFFTLKTDGYYYKDELVIPIRKVSENLVEGNEFTDLFADNAYIEKIFRNKVEEFLNNGSYKLFKSPTEGNIIVTLTNVSMTPNQALGRMIYDFAATAYEIADFDLENLNNCGIIDIGEFNEFSDEENIYVTGQISGLIKGNQTKINLLDEDHQDYWEGLPIRNILDEIKTSVSYDIGGGYRYDFVELVSFSFERYPVLDFKEEILELQAKISQSDGNDEELSDKILYYELLRAAAHEESSEPVVTINFDNKNIMVSKNRVYRAAEVLSSLSSISLEYSMPVIFNYVARVRRVENTEDTVQAINTSVSWGQIAGTFTSNINVLNNYNHDYMDFDYEIPSIVYVNNGTVEEPKLEFSYNYNNTAYNLYKTENIFDIIKAEVKKQVEKNYGTSFNNYDAEEDTWDDGVWYYKFNDIINISIEADKGTIIILKDYDGNEKTVVVGPSERYNLNPSDELIKYLTFKNSAFAIIDYKCSSIQTKKGTGGSL